MPNKNIVLCFDGTWNMPGESAGPTEDDSTNVCRFYELISASTLDGRQQVKWYNEGVGTEWLNRVRGGAFGLRLDQHVMDGYIQLIRQYKEGDDVYIVGFSRGAYTARSLVGLIRKCGLLKQNDDVLVRRSYEIYRSREKVDSEYAIAFRKANSCDIRVKFVGVWDTVGALGVPVESTHLFEASEYAFHDTRLSSIVHNAFQALALDEHRRHYEATLWGEQDEKDRMQGQILEQVWFSGAHADVGGGYKERTAIADLTLAWMQDKAARCGLGVQQVRTPDPRAIIESVIHDSFSEFLRGIYSWFVKRHYRVLGEKSGGPQKICSSVKRRISERADYRPKNNGLFELAEEDMFASR